MDEESGIAADVLGRGLRRDEETCGKCEERCVGELQEVGIE